MCTHAAHPALSLVAAVPLLDAALDEDKNRFALAALPGLCPWAAETLSSESVSLKTKFGQNPFEAAEAIASGKPRPGHSVLGQGTFRDAKPLWCEPAPCTFHLFSYPLPFFSCCQAAAALGR